MKEANHIGKNPCKCDVCKAMLHQFMEGSNQFKSMEKIFKKKQLQVLISFILLKIDMYLLEINK